MRGAGAVLDVGLRDDGASLSFVTPAPCSTEEAKRAPRHRPHAGLIADVQRWRPCCIWGAVIISLSALRHARLVRYLTSLSRRSEDFDQRSRDLTPVLQLSTRSSTNALLLQLVESCLNDLDRVIAVPVNKTSSGNPGDPMHDEKVRAESLRQVKLPMTQCSFSCAYVMPLHFNLLCCDG